MSHTPGPWRTGESFSGKLLVVTDKGESICQPVHSFENENKANSILMAAAPELLDRLEDLAGVVARIPATQKSIGLQELVDRAFQTINKAKGGK